MSKKDKKLISSLLYAIQHKWLIRYTHKHQYQYWIKRSNVFETSEFTGVKTL